MMVRQDKVDLDFCVEEDALLKALLESQHKRVEIVAFGIIYSGSLERVDVNLGTVLIRDGNDEAMIEIERIESFSVLSP